MYWVASGRKFSYVLGFFIVFWSGGEVFDRVSSIGRNALDVISCGFTPRDFFGINFEVIFRRVVGPFVKRQLDYGGLKCFGSYFARFLITLFSFGGVGREVGTIVFTIVGTFGYVIRYLLS